MIGFNLEIKAKNCRPSLTYNPWSIRFNRNQSITFITSNFIFIPSKRWHEKMSLWIDLYKNTILFCGKEFLRCQWKDFCIYISVYTSRTAEALGAGQGSWRRPPAWSWTRRWRAPCVTRHRRGQAEAAETDELRFGAMIGLGLELSMIRNVGPLSLSHLHHEQKHARGVAA